ncbi:hypothetical protein KP509_16G041800 [Ceratopteris richardii]|nr:hypothetical protein KP509_16G041800 [Ceratopteris richardii]
MRTGSCKFGSTCKFNHPPPMMSLPGSSMFPGPLTGTGNAPQLYPWPMPRPVYLQSPRLTGPSIAPMVLPPSPVSVPHWPYQVPIVTPEGQQPPLSASYIYGAAAPPQEPMAVSLIPPFVPSSATVRLPTPPSPSTSGFREETYPERPGEPECQFYMKTGECKYGSQCRYHHPKDRNAPPPSFFSHVGLPLRPGAPPCTFYSRFGYCKFGAACKFDHPMATATYPQVRIDAGQPHSYTADTMGVLAGSVAAPTTELSMDIYGQSYLRDVRREGVSTSTSLQAVDVHHGSSRG